ncbi:TIGR02444 family protein [Stutzerimonas stutzeri]|uniref:TIGR02444 family protein n=1 Tax=Stutzerimonas sp. S1 TaxID=3030652 RepID=UPI002224299B|nr:TIGR02444 family protein [Stutzerimonas sp. S1]MCW3149513.1 TIGR02444 family protein [Stutzerimonas sp. S1]
MPTADLWTFALACYARPGVESACLELQEHGADVCLLLCAAWLEARHIDATPERLQQLSEIAMPWQQQTLLPLRRLRQDWRARAKQDAELSQLREQLKALELQAERIVLGRLERVTRGWRSGATSSGWLGLLAAATGSEYRAALAVLRDAAVQTQRELSGA